MKKYHIGHHQVEIAAQGLAAMLSELVKRGEIRRIYPVPRGGIPAMYALKSALYSHVDAVIVNQLQIAEDPASAHLIIDDLYDSGATMRRFDDLPAYRAVLFSKGYPSSSSVAFGSLVEQGQWLVFPWEGSEQQSADDIPTRLLQFIGEDPQRGGLLETPRRFLKAWQDWTSGYTQSPSDILKVFEDGAEKCDELILIRDIPVYSHCEHHLAPFFGTAHVGYIPNGKIVGLSKLSRLVDIFAKRLQVQERLTNQIADALIEHLSPKGVGVVIECRHMCMESRGIQRQGATTVTSAMRGVLRESHAARAEFLELMRRDER